MTRLFRRFSLLTLPLVVASALPAFAQDEAENLITNPGFEDAVPWETDTPRPRYWLVHANAPVYVDASSDQHEAGVDTRSGERAVRLTDPRDWSDRWAVANLGRVELDGNDELTYSVWVRVENLDGREFVQMRVEQFDADGNLLAENPFQAGPKERPAAGEWTQLTWDLTARPDARMIRPLLVLSHGGNEQSTAVATFDDVSLTRR